MPPIQFPPPQYQLVKPIPTERESMNGALSSMSKSTPHVPAQSPTPSAFAKFDVAHLKRQFVEDNQRFREINHDKLRARERAMLADLQSLQIKKDRIKRLKH